MTYNIIYILGLLLVLLYLAMGFDDFLWDIFSLTKRKKYNKSRFDFKTLRSEPPKLLAVTIGAWNESEVIEDVIENLLTSIQYPKSMYHLFVGVYPNDFETLTLVTELDKKYGNVHAIVNTMNGPTSKAQNINNVITKIKEFEKINNLSFASITVHDAEDVVHPYELIVTNYLINKYSALQFPVFPLMQKPTLKNFFKTLTTGTYSDEFAENHYVTMVGRCSTGAFVPSAGTGLALSREVFNYFDTDEIFPDGSLTEDYRLSLTLFEKGLPMYYVLDSIPRVANNNKIVYDYVATRSMFPATFKKAVKQKTRWTLGITMQSVKLKEVFEKNNLSFMARYSIYRDLKAKVGNLLAFVGYPVFIYFIVSLFVPLPTIYPMYSLSWYLCLLVTIMMFERQIVRATSIYHVYGFKMMFYSCFLPPFVPIRTIWGNVINLVATLSAYKQKISSNKKEKAEQKELQKELQKQIDNEEDTQLDNAVDNQIAKEQPETQNLSKDIKWAKTEHTFLPKDILKRYHRTFGDILIEKDIINPEKLQEALANKPSNIHIGDYLLQQNLISEEEHLMVLALIKGIQYADMGDFSHYDLLSFDNIFDYELLKELMVLPILSSNDTYVVAYCEESPIDAQTILREKLGINLVSTLTSVDMVMSGLKIMSDNKNIFESTKAFELLNNNKINTEQYIIASNYATRSKKGVDEVLEMMGFVI